MNTRDAIAGAVLAGGTSRRMGRDKRWVEIDGTPLLERALAPLAHLTDEVFVIGGQPPYGDRQVADVRLVPDHRPGHGPLAGIETALRATDRHIVVVVAVDHPRVVPAVLERLADHLAAHDAADVAVLETDGPPQPLIAAYRTAAVTTIASLLDDGVRSATRALATLTVTTVPATLWRRDDTAGMTLRDIDTPDDLEHASTVDAPARPAGTS